jgi:hypothetical protein
MKTKKVKKKKNKKGKKSRINTSFHEVPIMGIKTAMRESGE